MFDFCIFIIVDLHLSIGILYTLQLKILLCCLLDPILIIDSLVKLALGCGQQSKGHESFDLLLIFDAVHV